MTSGSKIDDSRSTFSGFCGADLIGHFYQKVWSGVDSSPRPFVLPNDPPFQYYKWTGTGINAKRKLVWHPGKRNSPPRRRKSLYSDHTYGMTVLEKRNSLIDVYKTNDPSFHQVGSFEKCLGGAPLPLKWSPNDTSKLVGKLREQMNGSDFDPSVFLGTFGESLGTIGQAATRIGLAMGAAKKGNLFKAAKHLGINPSKHKNFVRKGADSISSDWLALQYGWLPLLSDVKNAAEFIASHTNTPFTKEYRARRSLSAVSLDTPVLKFGSSYLSERGQIIARISEYPTVTQFSGVMHPENVAWELLPWSFVVDWFIPIGSWLEARAFASTLVGEFTTTLSHRARANGGDGIITGTIRGRDTGGYYFSHRAVDRTVSADLDVPMPEFKTFAQSSSWMHAANAVGLFIQQGNKYR